MPFLRSYRATEFKFFRAATLCLILFYNFWLNGIQSTFWYLEKDKEYLEELSESLMNPNVCIEGKKSAISRYIRRQQMSFWASYNAKNPSSPLGILLKASGLEYRNYDKD